MAIEHHQIGGRLSARTGREVAETGLSRARGMIGDWRTSVNEAITPVRNFIRERPTQAALIGLGAVCGIAALLFLMRDRD